MAKEIVKKPNTLHVDLDEVKFDMYGQDIRDENLKQNDWDKIYQEMYKQIERLLKDGKNVVHDTGNFTKHERGLIRNIGDKVGVKTITIFVDTPHNTAKMRLEENRKNNQRFNISDEAFKNASAEMEIPGEDENTLIYNTSIPAQEWINQNLR